MVLWRISVFQDLKGIGGLLFAARWHEAGSPVVYLAESPAGALLEICANTVADDVPPTYTLLRIEGPDVEAEEIMLTQLSTGWVGDFEETRRIGSAWLEGRTAALLRVPSSIVPETWNFLLNPLHPDAGLFAIERSYEYPFDLRIKG